MGGRQRKEDAVRSGWPGAGGGLGYKGWGLQGDPCLLPPCLHWMWNACLPWYLFYVVGLCRAPRLQKAVNHVPFSWRASASNKAWYTGTQYTFHDEFLPYPSWPAITEERTGIRAGVIAKRVHLASLSHSSYLSKLQVWWWCW